MNSKLWIVSSILLVGLCTSTHAQNPIIPPDPSVCDGIVDPCEADDALCDSEGFRIRLVSFTPAETSTSGEATYVYEICEPLAGTCSTSGASCLDNSQCADGETCSRECAVEKFHGLSHFDVAFPLLAATSCLGADNAVSGTCACTSGSSSTCSVASTVVIGDSACFPNSCVKTDTCSVGSGSNKTCSVSAKPCRNDGDCDPGTCSETGESCQTNGNCGPTPVAKCDSTNLNPGDCIQMTLQIAGETSGLGEGPVVVVSKDATTCQSSCVKGPSCDTCNPPPPPGDPCLTRTIGFWGNHPWVTNDFDPVTVCGVALGCNGAPDGKSNPSCPALQCNSITEGLCSNPSEISNNAYVSMVRQLTAAKLNLNTTATLGGTCADWKYQGKSIQEWITTCEALCGASKSVISNSGCIEALDAFNNSEDANLDQTPPPFDRPSVDDYGKISGADSSQCQLAKGNSNKQKLVIGQNVKGGGQCAP